MKISIVFGMIIFFCVNLKTTANEEFTLDEIKLKQAVESIRSSTESSNGVSFYKFVGRGDLLDIKDTDEYYDYKNYKYSDGDIENFLLNQGLIDNNPSNLRVKIRAWPQIAIDTFLSCLPPDASKIRNFLSKYDKIALIAIGQCDVDTGDQFRSIRWNLICTTQQNNNLIIINFDQVWT
jgi:hypothetical protein